MDMKQIVLRHTCGTLLLPSQAFNAKGCFRVVLMMPDKEIEEALGRIQRFCCRHYSRVQR